MTTQRRFIALAIGLIMCTILANVPLVATPGASTTAKA